MTERFIIAYIAVILGVATYFYLRKSIRNWRRRREAHRKTIPYVYYVYRTPHLDADDRNYLHSVHTSFDEAVAERNRADKATDGLIRRYGIYSEPVKRLRKEDA